MSIWHIIVLSIIQGITEFLPVSSSGHLILVPIFTNWQDQGLLLDVAVHMGTLGAVILYLSKDLWGMLVGLCRVLRGRRDPRAKLFLHLIMGSVPVMVCGYFLHSYYPNFFRSLVVIGWATLGFGILLAFSDWLGMTVRRIEHLRLSDSIFIGLLQVLALIPGTSRSGVTISAARLLGFERPDAARFSMLLSIPVIGAAGFLSGLELLKLDDLSITMDALLAGCLSFCVALVSIFLLMAWLRRATLIPFVFYRLILGALLLAIGYGFNF